MFLMALLRRWRGLQFSTRAWPADAYTSANYVSNES